MRGGEGGRKGRERRKARGDEREREKMPKPILLEEVQDIPPRPDNMTKSSLRFPKINSLGVVQNARHPADYKIGSLSNALHPLLPT